ncbi:hypothetical protein FQN57_000266 [Myotisia sp. PD_48]|nr:hypothetical protein FQN57_000266 [Myotisia sp. PD_48]
MGYSSIVCIGIIGKQNNLLHMSLFGEYAERTNSKVEFALILNSSLDIFDMRQQRAPTEQDLGLLHAVDERLCVYGWLTNTGVKFAIVVDLKTPPYTGREIPTPVVGLRDSDLKPAFRALQSSYVKLLQNPFYSPDDHSLADINRSQAPPGGITNRQFIAEIQRIAQIWAPGVTDI